MPIRFSTEAANADVLGDDADAGRTPEGMPTAAGATARQRFSGPQRRGRNPADPPDGQAKPGKDINAAGFIKDKDASKP